MVAASIPRAVHRRNRGWPRNTGLSDGLGGQGCLYTWPEDVGFSYSFPYLFLWATGKPALSGKTSFPSELESSDTTTCFEIVFKASGEEPSLQTCSTYFPAGTSAIAIFPCWLETP